MFRLEMKKLLIKQYALPALIILVILEMIFLSFQYSKYEFANEITQEYYHNYMTYLQGKLDSQKEQYILAERESISSAEADYITIQNKMMNGGFSDENEYLAELVRLRSVMEKSDAFDLVYECYTHAAQNTENRYIIPFGAEGMCRDYPDILMLIFVVAVSSVYFLTEESSGMITLIRSCSGKGKNVFSAKICAVFSLIVPAQLLISLCEFCFLWNNIDKNVLIYPVQSLRYFGNCKLKLSIVSAFVIIQLLKLIGYIFILMLTVLVSAVSKKPVFTAALPLSCSLLQQFVFTEQSKAYYLPTGLLRATGYLRGDSYETRKEYDKTVFVKVFSDVPNQVLIGVIVFTAVFIIIAIFVGWNHYTSVNTRKNRKALSVAVMIFVMMIGLSGCGDSENHAQKAYYNMSEHGFIARTDNFYYTYSDQGSGKLVLLENSYDGSSNELIRDAFIDDTVINDLCTADKMLYCTEITGSRGFTLYSISLDDYTVRTAAEQSMEQMYSFLGISRGNTVKLDKTLRTVFTDSINLFLVGVDGEIYKSDMKLNKPECIISDGIYKDNLIYNGEKIYYVNLNLELNAYDVASGKNEKLSGGFVKSLALCSDALLYSNADGLFKMNLSDNTIEKICDKNAEYISASDDAVVILSKDKLHLLKDGKCTEIYSGRILSFCCLNGNNKVLCRRVADDKIEEFYIDIL